MSPVFRHGRLRLYLLKLLDEAPRHGYEVIRLLQDRFMGVYAPSPGTIYPRLARLEEDGLVTHEEVDGKKVYSITDKGREEIRSRLGDLADLEDELSESLRDVAREISVDVRDTVRSIREELASAAREFRFQDTGRGDRTKGGATTAGTAGRADTDTAGQPQGAGGSAEGAAGGHAEGAAAAAGDAGDAGAAGAAGDAGAAGGAGAGAGSESGRGPSEEARRIREEARRTREQMREDFRARSRSRTDWAGWSAWSEWASGKDWAGGDWMSGHDWGGRKDRGAGPKARRGAPYPFSDLERMAIQFANELRAAAKQTGNLGERSLNDLRDILTDTLAKVRDEVFGPDSPAGRTAGADQPGGAGDTPTPDATAADKAPRADAAGSDQARSSEAERRDTKPGDSPPGRPGDAK